MVKLNPSAARFLQVLQKLSGGFFMNDSDQTQFPNYDENFIQQSIEESPITQMLSVRAVDVSQIPPLYGQDGQLLSVISLLYSLMPTDS